MSIELLIAKALLKRKFYSFFGIADLAVLLAGCGFHAYDVGLFIEAVVQQCIFNMECFKRFDLLIFNIDPGNILLNFKTNVIEGGDLFVDLNDQMSLQILVDEFIYLFFI